MPAVSAGSKKPSVRDPNDPNFRFYEPPHPATDDRVPLQNAAGFGRDYNIRISSQTSAISTETTASFMGRAIRKS